MGFNRILQCLLLTLMPIYLVTGCGDLEPEMQDTRTVILNMDFDQRSSSRTSRAELINVDPYQTHINVDPYQTHLIMVLTSENIVLTSGENLSNSNYWDYKDSNQGEVEVAPKMYVLYDSDRTITLNMNLNTKMKIFAFLFNENYSCSRCITGNRSHFQNDLFTENRTAGYYGESQIITISHNSQTANIELNPVLGELLEDFDDPGGGDFGGDDDLGGDTFGEDDFGGDTTAPTASVTTATITTSGNAVVQSTETGTAYLVNTTVPVSNLTSITGAADNQQKSVAITLANTDTNLPAMGLADGTYKVYAVDTAGNLSNASSNSVTVATTYNLTAPNNFSASGTSNTVTLSWNSVSGALSYTLYWDNVSGIDSSDNAFNNITNDNYTHSGLDNGTTYYYKVTAVDSTGTMGTLSSEVNASIPLPAPDNLSASGANNTITLTWNSVSGATSYTLYWGNVSGIDSSDNAFNNITNDNYTHSSLANGSIYYYKVAAVNSSGTGTLSSVASAILASNIQASKTFNDHTYALTSATMTWNNAKTAATALGGYLTTINTKAENDWLTAIFRIPYGDSWIGANDIATSDTWVWDNGTTSGDSELTDNLSSNAKWADNITNKWENGEPNGIGASCGYIWKTSGTWDDTACSSNKYAIIEFD
jgi:hypothetical protein